MLNSNFLKRILTNIDHLFNGSICNIKIMWYKNNLSLWQTFLNGGYAFLWFEQYEIHLFVGALIYIPIIATVLALLLLCTGNESDHECILGNDSYIICREERNGKTHSTCKSKYVWFWNLVQQYHYPHFFNIYFFEKIKMYLTAFLDKCFAGCHHQEECARRLITLWHSLLHVPLKVKI